MTETVSLARNTIDRDPLFRSYNHIFDSQNLSLPLTETVSLAKNTIDRECMSEQFNQLEDEWESGSVQLFIVHPQICTKHLE